MLISSPAPLYFWWLSSEANPTWRQALAQYDNLGATTPSPLHLLILLGPTFLLALLQVGVFAARQRSGDRLSDRTLFLGGWFIANIAVIYLPLRFQIMLLTGLQFVMAVLATDFLYERVVPWLAGRQLPTWWNSARVPPGRLVSTLFLLAVIPTNVYLFAWRIVDLRRQQAPYYLDRDLIAAFDWLERTGEREDVVLSSFATGHYVAGLTGLRPFYANAVMTLDAHLKEDVVSRIFSADATDEERQNLLRQYDIGYIIHGELERELGTFDPSRAEYLTPTFHLGDTTVFRVIATPHEGMPS